MFWAHCLFFGLLLVPFIAAKLVLHATVEQLAGPYFAFSASGVIFVLLAWRLRVWEEHSPSPRRLALSWSLSIALFYSLIAAALFYSGVSLHFLNPSDTDIFIVAGVVGAFGSSFMMYFRILPKISARASRNVNGATPK